MPGAFDFHESIHGLFHLWVNGVGTVSPSHPGIQPITYFSWLNPRMRNPWIWRANCTEPFYVRDLSVHCFWYPWGAPGTNAQQILRADCTRFKSYCQLHLYCRCKSLSSKWTELTKGTGDYVRKLKMLGNKLFTYMGDYKEFTIKCTSQNPFRRKKKNEKLIYMMRETAIHPNCSNQ